MKEKNKDKRGITLVALIITIIVMLILVAVSVQIVINSGLFDSAKTAAKKTEKAYRAEATEGGKVNIDGEIYNSLEEYLEGDKTENVVTEGDYVKYDVAYTDVYMSSYNYTATNGWRLLHATPNGNGTYRDVELISTGVPAKFHYNYNNAKTWWVTDSNKLIEFKNLLGGSNYTFYNDGEECYNLKAAAGLYYNFGNLPFIDTSSPSVGNGGYTTITNNDQKSGTTAGTGAALFLTNKASGVRLLTLKELNEARGITNDPDNTGDITAAQDPIGLYYLGNLKSVSGIGTTTYTTDCYWLASPWPDCYGNDVSLVISSSSISYAGISTSGVRPIVKISRF